ncbi:hypothetical protein ACIBCT_27485 [Streptosporangium sp. NPDC050855]|uniref:hypothetical protein n=1 Tax=Streptosporangium sp. NPDC050855 TaxID=3366194 RepID=UPI0037A77E58
MLAALGVAVALLLAPAAVSADARTALTSPVILAFEDGTKTSVNAPGSRTITPPRRAYEVRAGSWSGYVVHSDGGRTYFCGGETAGLTDAPVSGLFVSRLKGWWCP